MYGGWDLWEDDHAFAKAKVKYTVVGGMRQATLPPPPANSRLLGLCVGDRIQKKFEGHGMYTGVLTSWREPYFTVTYPDGDEEEMTPSECFQCRLLFTKVDGRSCKVSVLLCGRSASTINALEEHSEGKTEAAQKAEEAPGSPLTAGNSSNRLANETKPTG